MVKSIQCSKNTKINYKNNYIIFIPGILEGVIYPGIME
jgi:hypothetical protein